MPSLRTSAITPVVVSLAAERQNRRGRAVPEAEKLVSNDVENAYPLETKTSAEILSINNDISSSLSPIVPEVRNKQKSPTKSRRQSTSKEPHDEQCALEEIESRIRAASAKELKARFPKAWKEHDTLKRKTRGTRAWLQLHPAFARFPDFLKHMGPCPHPSHSIERLDPDNPVYGPGLCKWLDDKGQANNRSNNTHITWAGLRRTVAEWSELAGIPYKTLQRRQHRGWPEAKLFEDAAVRKYRTDHVLGAAQMTPTVAEEVQPTPQAVEQRGPHVPGIDVALVPVMPADGWPEGVNHYQYEAGHQHAVAQARKHGITPPSRAFFGCWVLGSIVNEARASIYDEGLSYIFFRDQVTDPADFSEYDAKARKSKAVRDFLQYQPVLNCFISAYREEQKRQAYRYGDGDTPKTTTPMYEIYRARQAARTDSVRQRLCFLWKNKPCISPADAWEYY